MPKISAKFDRGHPPTRAPNAGGVDQNRRLWTTKFCKDRSNRCGDIAIFVIFKMAAAAILNFQKFKILTVDPL